ncbi:type II toxin-antitoxin system HicA family toxin [Sphingomonas sp. MMS24-JH45]
MNRRQTKVLQAIFSDPVPGTIAWREIEGLLVAAGCEVIEGKGSAVRFVKDGLIAYFHRPHPATKRSAIRFGMRGSIWSSWSCTVTAMSYKGLSARVEFDADDEIFTGRVAGINDVVGFHSDTASGLKEAFREAVDGYLDACASIGREPERAFSAS